MCRVQEPGTSGDRNKDASPVVSPDRTITCPICLDTDKEVCNKLCSYVIMLLCYVVMLCCCCYVIM